MAGDWIKLEVVTPDKPEVHEMAELLGVSTNEVIGALAKLWVWADQQSLNGHAMRVTDVTLESRCNLHNLAKALRQVGWLTGESMALTLPNFERHNGETAKKRALARDRKVTQRSREKSDQRREEKKVTTGVCESREELPTSTPKDQTVSRKKTKPALSAEALQALKFLNQTTGKNFRPVEVNLSLIQARMDSGVSLEDIKTVIVRKWRDWKDREDMQQYLRPETLFGKTKFEQYLGEIPPQSEAQNALV